MNAIPSERFAVLSAINPGSIAASTVLTAYVPAGNYKYFAGVVAAGTLGAAATLDAKLVQATDAAGTGSKDIPGKLITQMTQAGTDSNKQAIVNANVDDMDRNNGFFYIALSLTVGVAASGAAGLLLGFAPRNMPPTQGTTVDSVI